MKRYISFIFRWFGFCIVVLFMSASANAVTVETDRTWYVAGETMKVSVTVDDAKIAYAELCDTYGLAAGVVFSLTENEGTGLMELPTDLHSGYYVLSAYTRNSAKVAQRFVAIVNPLRKSEDDDIEWVLGDSCWVLAPTPQHLAPTPHHLTPTPHHLTPTPHHLTPTTHHPTPNTPELEGHIIEARVQNVYEGNTFKGSQIRPSLSIVGKQIHYFEGKMVNDSMAVFYTYGIHGRQPLVLSAMTHTGVSLPIEIISPFATLLPKQLPHLVFHYNRREVEARSLDMQRHQWLRMGDKKTGMDAPTGMMALEPEAAEDGVPLDYDDTLFGARPSLTYNLDEYRQFHSIREVLFEYVNCVSKKKINDVPQLIVTIDQDSYISSWPALVLIDGMPVIDIERLLNYDARRIHYINIYGGKYTFGNGVHNGILSFISRSGRLTNYPTEPNVQYLVYVFP